jgi:hypothetical protein
VEKKLEGHVPQDTFSVILTAVMNVLYHQSSGIEELTLKIQASDASDPKGVGEKLLDIVRSTEGGKPPSGPVDFLYEWSEVLRRSLLLTDDTPPHLQEIVDQILDLSAREGSTDEERLNQAYGAACRLLSAEPVDSE